MALALGRSVGELLKSLSSRELAEWAAYERVEPFGSKRSDFHAGLITSAVYNVNRGKGTKAFSPVDFMPKVVAPAAPMKTSKKVRKAMAELMNKTKGGK